MTHAVQDASPLIQEHRDVERSRTVEPAALAQPQPQPHRRASVALVGTRGVPARYGGFETCVEEVGKRLVQQGFEVTVYCRRSPGEPELTEYEGMRLVYRRAVRRRALETLTHTLASLLHVRRHRVDSVIVFNAANSIWLPLVRSAGIPVAVHVDGLEWRRGKWGLIGQLYYRLAESLAVRWANALISDAKGIASYYAEEFGRDSIHLAYGAPEVAPTSGDSLERLGLTPGRFHLVVARFEPENHVREIIEGYTASAAEFPLVVVGSAPYAAEYTQQIHDAADDRTLFLGSVWDQELLNDLYQHSASYLHGHSVGGTNPSLLRAMGAGAVCVAYDVVFNREVLADSGLFFTAPSDLALTLQRIEKGDLAGTLRTAARRRADTYSWDGVSQGYADLVEELAQGRHVAPRLGLRSRRRRSKWSHERRLLNLLLAALRR